MLRIIEEGQLEEVVEKAWEIKSNPKLDSYPRFKSKTNLKNAFEKGIKHIDDQILGFYIQQDLVGVVKLEVIKEEQYIQTVGIYISDRYEEIMEELIEYLGKNYVGYHVFFGYPKENEQAEMFFGNKKIACIESSLDMRLNLVEYIRGEKSPKVSRLLEERFEEYAFFHDKHIGEIYWTSERMKMVLEKWFIYIYKEEEEIVGSIFINKQTQEMLEVFGLLVDTKYIGDGIEQALIETAIEDLLEKNPQYQEVIYFIDEASKEELKGAERIGFKLTDHYRCFKMDL